MGGELAGYGGEPGVSDVGNSSGITGCGTVRLSRAALVAGELCPVSGAGQPGALLAAAPANTGCNAGATRLL